MESKEEYMYTEILTSQEFVDSGDELLKGKLTSENHLHNKYSNGSDFMNVDEGVCDIKTVYHDIVSWKDERLGAELLDIVIYKDGDEIVAWEPVIEKEIRVEHLDDLFESGLQVVGMRWGYIEGRKHHLDTFMNSPQYSESSDPGYRIYYNFIIRR